MKEEIICAGFGGQGIMLLGKVIAQGALKEKRHLTWIPSYGAAIRGGCAYCSVVISDKEIASPYIDKCDTLFVFNQPSWVKFKSKVKKEGLVLLNSTLIPSQKSPGSNLGMNGVWLGEGASRKSGIHVREIVNSRKVPRAKVRGAPLENKFAARSIKILKAPFTEMASSLGDMRVANMVALGAFLKAKNILKYKTVLEVFSSIAPKNKPHLLTINKKALEQGYQIA